MTPFYFERRLGTAKRYGRLAYEVGRTVLGKMQPYAGMGGSGTRPAVLIGQGRSRKEAIADFELRHKEVWSRP